MTYLSPLPCQGLKDLRMSPCSRQKDPTAEQYLNIKVLEIYFYFIELHSKYRNLFFYIHVILLLYLFPLRLNISFCFRSLSMFSPRIRNGTIVNDIYEL